MTPSSSLLRIRGCLRSLFGPAPPPSFSKKRKTLLSETEATRPSSSEGTVPSSLNSDLSRNEGKRVGENEREQPQEEGVKPRQQEFRVCTLPPSMKKNIGKRKKRPCNRQSLSRETE